MAKKLETILAKKSWTGKEVGIALLRNLEHDLQHVGEIGTEPLFPQAEFDKMRKSLDTERKWYEYAVYSGIYTTILEARPIALSMLQQFFNGYNRYFLEMRETQRAEDTYRNLEQFPLVLTEKRYKEIIDGEREKKRALKESFYSLVFHTLSQALEIYGEDEQPPADFEKIIAALEATQAERATNPRILENYYEDTEAGYYILEDGRRSDRLTPEEWQAALEARFMERHSLTIDGNPATARETAEYFNQERYLQRLKLLFSGADGIIEAARERGKELTQQEAEEIEELLEGEIDTVAYARVSKSLAIALEDDKPLEWHTPDEPPTPTKLEVLENALERYSGGWTDRLVNGEFVPEIPEREQYKEFKRDYPQLAAALEAFIRERIPAAASLKPAQYFKPLITWGELADLPFTGFPKLVEVGDGDIAQYYAEQETTDGLVKSARVAGHGIALLQGTPRVWDDDGSGELKDPMGTAQQILASLNTLEALEQDTDHIQHIQESLNIIALPALRYIYAYNTFLDTVAAAFDVSFIAKAARMDMKYPESQIEALNNLMYFLYKDVYGTKTEKKRKRELIKEIFQPIEVEREKPTPEAVEQLKARIEGASKQEVSEMLKRPNYLIFDIMRKGEADE